MRIKGKLAFINHLLRVSVRHKITDNKIADKSPLKNYEIAPSKSVSFRYEFKKKLQRNTFLYNLWATAAYIKASLFHRANYLISDSLHLIYTRVPKAASTFLAYEMMKKLDPTIPFGLSDKEINLIAPRYANRSIPIGKRNYASFSVVRNPFHRLVAVHREFFQTNPNEDFIYERYLFGVLKRDMDFKNFVNAIDLIPDFLKDRHFKPQSYILKEAVKKTDVRIFTLEKHQHELHAFLKNYELAMPEQEENSRRYDYRSYYDMATARKVRSIYIQDIKDFDYEDIWNDLVAAIESKQVNSKTDHDQNRS